MHDERPIVQRVFILIVLLLSGGCATIGPSRVVAQLERPRACQESLDEVDGVIRMAGVTDASSFSVPGFPYLRTSRFLLAMKDHLETEQQKEEWLQLMRQLDDESREKEILNLPESYLSGLQRYGAAPVDRKDIIAETRTCAQELFRHDSTRPNFIETLLPHLKAPDEYSSTRRALGFFPIVSIPVNIVSERVKKRFQSVFNEPINQSINFRLRAI